MRAALTEASVAGLISWSTTFGWRRAFDLSVSSNTSIILMAGAEPVGALALTVKLTTRCSCAIVGPRNSAPTVGTCIAPVCSTLPGVEKRVGGGLARVLEHGRVEIYLEVAVGHAVVARARAHVQLEAHPISGKQRACWQVYAFTISRSSGCTYFSIIFRARCAEISLFVRSPLAAWSMKSATCTTSKAVPAPLEGTSFFCLSKARCSTCARTASTVGMRFCVSAEPSGNAAGSVSSYTRVCTLP
eukprot:1231642-Pleurochrysis_carterae.AAC.1